MEDASHTELEAARQALAREQELRQALEADLQRSAQIGQELLLKNEELEQAVREHAETAVPQASARKISGADVVPQVRRARTMPVRSKEASDDPNGEDESDGEGVIMPKPRTALRRGRAGKTVMVEELMSANQSLHEDLMRLKEERRQCGFLEPAEMEEDEEDIQNVDHEESNAREELQLRVAALESEKRQLQKELQASQEKAARTLQIEEELEVARSSLRDVQGQLTSLEDRNRALRTSQQALDAERMKLASLLEAAENRCAHLEQELEQTTMARARSRKSTGTIAPIGEEAASALLGASLASELAQDGHASQEEALRLDCISAATELRAEMGALSRSTASCKAWLVAARKLCAEKPAAPPTQYVDGRSDDEASP